ncbi:branched-chain amino acid ABC transporter permease [Methylobacterium radiotolerans]|nr:branched-chain amino acid ABC transporter permease [Methylobacterium radiotolerans]
MNELIQHLVNALILGGTYALLGIGLTLIFGIMNVVNFTHGALYTVGAYVMYLAVAALGAELLPGTAGGDPRRPAARGRDRAAAAAPFRGSDIDTTMLVMIGAGIVLQSGTLWTFGGVAKAIPSPFPEAPLQVGPVSVSWLRLFVLGAALTLIALTYALINRTKLGLAMRAAFQDSDTAALMGVDVRRIYTATFALGSSLAAAAGALLGPVYVVFPQMGGLAELKAFAIVILGGLGNVTGAAIGGFILALAEELGAGYVSSGYRDAMGFLIIIAVLLYRPTGLFAKAERIG